MNRIASLYYLAFDTGLNAAITFFIFFLLLYFGGIALYRAALYFLKKYYGFYAIQHNLRKGQIAFEIRHSLLSILVFSLQAIPLQYLVAQGYAQLSFGNAWVLLWQIPLLFLWNEIHFYLVHALLHRKWLMKRVHFLHHRSKEPTLFSVYSFHWFEAFLLGTVIFLPMTLYSFHIFAILSLPVMSILLNLMGHSNHEGPSAKDPEHISRFIFRHSMHHKWSNGNFGFMLPYLDRLFNTKLPKNKH